MHLGQVVLLCLACSLSPAEALKGQQFPIPRDELYENYHGAAKAATEEEDVHSVDYNCRYSVSRTCYCCGAFFHYIEQGSVCTKYCIAGVTTPGEPKFCQRRLIVLPFNWGDNSPDRITLDNGGRGAQASNVHFPYDSSAPADCPQDPYMIHSEPKVPSEPVMSGNKWSPGGAVTSRTTTTRSPSLRRPGGNKWLSTAQSGDEAAVERGQKQETPRSRPPMRNPERRPMGDRPVWSRQPVSSNPTVRPVTIGGNDDITTPQPSSRKPSISQPGSISRPGRCPSGASCVPMGRCPSFLHDRSALRQLARGSRAYTQALGGLKASVCDKKDKLVCCVGWS